MASPGASLVPKGPNEERKHDLNHHFLRQEVAPISTLVPEILAEIVGFLPTPDFGSFRRTCKLINYRVLHPFDTRYFVIKQFMISEHSLQALVAISKHPRLSQVLKTVIIGMDNYQNRVPVPPQYLVPVVDAVPGDRDRDCVATLRGLLISRSDLKVLSEVTNFENFLKAPNQNGYGDVYLRDLYWDATRAQQQMLIRETPVVAPLVEAFGNLKNLETISVQDFPFGKSYGAFTSIKISGYAPDMKQPTPAYRFPFQILGLLLFAVWRSQRQLKTLNLLMGESNYSPYHTQSVDGLKPSIDDELLVDGMLDDMVSSLTTLRIPVHIVFTAIQSSNPSILARTKKLEVLELNFENQPSADINMQRLCRPWPHGHLLGSPAAFPAPSPLPFLRKLALTSFQVELPVLVQVMRAYVASLEVVAFRAASIAHEVDDTNPYEMTDDENEDEDDDVDENEDDEDDEDEEGDEDGEDAGVGVGITLDDELHDLFVADMGVEGSEEDRDEAMTSGDELLDILLEGRADGVNHTGGLTEAFIDGRDEYLAGDHSDDNYAAGLIAVYENDAVGEDEADVDEQDSEDGENWEAFEATYDDDLNGTAASLDETSNGEVFSQKRADREAMREAQEMDFVFVDHWVYQHYAPYVRQPEAFRNANPLHETSNADDDRFGGENETGNQDLYDDATLSPKEHDSDVSAQHEQGESLEPEDENDKNSNSAFIASPGEVAVKVVNQWSLLFDQLARDREYTAVCRLSRVVLENVGQSTRYIQSSGPRVEYALGPGDTAHGGLQNVHEFNQEGLPATPWLLSIGGRLLLAGVCPSTTMRNVTCFLQRDDDAHMKRFVGRGGGADKPKYVNSHEGLKRRES